MQKLRMSLDDLQVESFAPDEAGRGSPGTVFAHLKEGAGTVVYNPYEDTDYSMQTAPVPGCCMESGVVSCPAGQTCGDTCGLCEAHKPLERG